MFRASSKGGRLLCDFRHCSDCCGLPVQQMSENPCHRVLFEPSSALARTFEIEAGTLDPDGPLLLRPALDPAPVDEVRADLLEIARCDDAF